MNIVKLLIRLVVPGIVVGCLAGLACGLLHPNFRYGLLALFLGLLGFLSLPDTNYGTSFFPWEGPPIPAWLTWLIQHVMPLNAVVASVSFAIVAFMMTNSTKSGRAP